MPFYSLHRKRSFLFIAFLFIFSIGLTLSSTAFAERRQLDDDKEHIPSLRELLKQYDKANQEQKVVILRQLAFQKTTLDSLKLLFKALQSKKDEIRQAAEEALKKATFHSKTFVPVVLQAMQSKNINVSANGFDLAARIQFESPKILAYLEKLLKSSKIEKRLLGLDTLGKIGKHAQKSYPAILSIFYQSQYPIQTTSAISLCQIDRKKAARSEVIDIMMSILNDTATSPDAKQEAIKALSTCRESSVRALPLLFKALQGKIQGKILHLKRIKSMEVPSYLHGTPKFLPIEQPIPTSQPSQPSQSSQSSAAQPSQPSRAAFPPPQAQEKRKLSNMNIRIEAMKAIKNIAQDSPTIEKLLMELFDIAKNPNSLPPIHFAALATLASLQKHSKRIIPFLMEQLKKTKEEPNFQTLLNLLRKTKMNDPQFAIAFIKIYPSIPEDRQKLVLFSLAYQLPKTPKYQEFLWTLVEKSQKKKAQEAPITPFLLSLLGSFSDPRGIFFKKFLKLADEQKFPYRVELFDLLLKYPKKAQAHWKKIFQLFKKLPPSMQFTFLDNLPKIAPKDFDPIEEKCRLLLKKGAFLKMLKQQLRREGEKAFPTYKRLMMGKEKKLALTIIQFIGSLGKNAQKLSPTLKKLTQHKDKQIAQTARQALQKIQTPTLKK